MRDNRRAERYPISVEVEVVMPGFFRSKRRRFHTRDMSNSGVFLLGDGRSLPVVGTEVTVQVMGQLGGEPAPVVRAKVVRVGRDGMAVTFLKS